MLRDWVAVLCVAACACTTNDDRTTAGAEACPNVLGWDATVLDDGGATLEVHACVNDQCFDASTPIQRNDPVKEMVPDHQEQRASFTLVAQPGRHEVESGCVDTGENEPASACVQVRLDYISFALHDGDVALLRVQNESGDEVLHTSAAVDYREVDFGEGRACQQQYLVVDLDGVVEQGDAGPTAPR